MNTNTEIDNAKQIIIDCAEDVQLDNVYPNSKDSRFWGNLKWYTHYSDAERVIEDELGYSHVIKLAEEGFDLAQEKIDNGNALDVLRLQKQAISGLGELLQYLITEARELPDLKHEFQNNSMFEDWADLPTFGGVAPSDTSEIWSWDETHLLVGTWSGDLEIIPRNINPTRMAIIDKDGLKLSDVQQYLPTNYGAFRRVDGRIQITGRDDHGWTMDGYVIPRLASGLIPAREFTSMKEEERKETFRVRWNEQLYFDLNIEASSESDAIKLALAAVYGEGSEKHIMKLGVREGGVGDDIFDAAFEAHINSLHAKVHPSEEGNK
jgi:hypothetical protein